MPRIFISYSRNSQDVAKNLVTDIQALGCTVWFDQDLSGGQAWWDQILAIIRDSDVFVFVLDADGLNSAACQREFGYAAALGKPILPVLVADGFSTNLLPPELSRLQFIDYRQQDRKSGLSLARALSAIPPSTALPDPLPEPPEVPVSYLGGLTRKINAATALSYEEQGALVVDLKRGLRDLKAADDTRVLLARLRARRDLFAAMAEEIDELLGNPSPSIPAPQVIPAPKPQRVEASPPPPTHVVPIDPAPKPPPDSPTPQAADVSPPRHAAPAIPPPGRSWYHRSRTLLWCALALLATIGYFVYAIYISPRFWKDPATHITWTRHDNGADITQPDALQYCQNLRLEGLVWELPTIDQLETLSAHPGVKGDVKLSLADLYWSSSSGNGPGEALTLLFTPDTRFSNDRGSSYGMRAVCVLGY